MTIFRRIACVCAQADLYTDKPVSEKCGSPTFYVEMKGFEISQKGSKDGFDD
jgi:hypothetical protein